MAIFSRKAKSPVAVPAPSTNASGLESRTVEIGSDILARARSHKAGLLSAKFYSDKLMDWSMKDQAFKVQLFRFVDAFPMLTTPDAIHDHLADYLSQPGVKTPPGMDLGLKAGGLAKGLFASTIAGQIKGMASKFIAGTDAASALPGLAELWNDGIAFSVDLLGEACVSDAEADAYRDKYLDLVGNLPASVAGWRANPAIETDHLGGIPRTNVSIKISSLSAKCDPIDTEGSIRDLMSRIVPILELAKAKGVLINFDMEQFSRKDLTLELFMRCCEAVDFQAGLAMQAYLKSGVSDAKRIAEWAKRTGRIVTVRLVKGAYWDYETIHAEQQGWPCPVWPEKWQSDRCFEEMTDVFLDASPRSGGAETGGGGLGPTRLAAGSGGVKLALGSHNVRSIGHAVAALEARNLPRNALEIQMLHGMADQLKHAAAETGLRVREYVPVGEMIPGMAYLVRRLLENTSNESWLKAGFLDNADASILLAIPARKSGAPEKKDLLGVSAERHNLSPSHPRVGNGKPFTNEPMRDFADAKVREAYARAIAGAVVPTGDKLLDADQARHMLDTAHKAFPRWRDTPQVERSACLVRAAAAMRARRDELAGVMVKEAGKTWREADADICEAIDFCEYYARTAMPMFTPARLGRFIGELDEVWYQPKGIAVIISPWNFPSAIFTGMTAAALVTGNCALVKPSRQTVGIARLCTEILWEAGIPRDVLHFCHAPGSTVGSVLVRDPRVSMIAFTGSKEVGLDIIEGAAHTVPGQANVKKIIAEMGGKNAIIVDTSADLDEAVLGVRYSAFGFQGQKCSACSRCIVVDPEGPEGEATRLFITRLVEATRSLVVADPTLPGSDFGPVIDASSKKSILAYIEKGKAECRLELAMEVPAGLEEKTKRDWVPPHIFSHVTMEHAIGKEEIFGPVLSIFHARTFEEALEIANASEFKLTGAVYSRKPAHIDRAKREFRVGNLYINRGSTGALVARQPFGGAGMSGVGTKAGGADYLLHFTDPRACCENTMRRGFARNCDGCTLLATGDRHHRGAETTLAPGSPQDRVPDLIKDRLHIAESLRRHLDCRRLSQFCPETVAFEAGRLMRTRIRHLANLFELYLPLATTWRMYNNGGDDGPKLIASSRSLMQNSGPTSKAQPGSTDRIGPVERGPPTRGGFCNANADPGLKRPDARFLATTAKGIPSSWPRTGRYARSTPDRRRPWRRGPQVPAGIAIRFAGAAQGLSF
ncbi:MAG: proline dehydrogenase family protein [Phycisphaerales bacterium]|nr:proline dehydrogenase family protein [Phycisphaerales bacterium]